LTPAFRKSKNIVPEQLEYCGRIDRQPALQRAFEATGIRRVNQAYRGAPT